jgi:ubiquinone/menaquinone biosynthesis C-methylase UbiE
MQQKQFLKKTIKGRLMSEYQEHPKNSTKHQDILNKNKSILKQKVLTYKLLSLNNGSKILDVGCGNGDDLNSVAKISNYQGEFIGVSNDQNMLNEALYRYNNAKLSFLFADANETLPFPNNYFDGVRADRVFLYLENPKHTLSEMIRVVKPKGKVVVNDTDIGTFLFSGENLDNINRYYIETLATWFNNPWIGRQLYGLFTDLELKNINVYPITLTFTDFNAARKIYIIDQVIEKMVSIKRITSVQGKEWLSYLQSQADADKFFCIANQFAVCGNK